MGPNFISSLRSFARVDVGIMRDPVSKEVGYFVNEVERSTTAGLFGNAIGEEHVRSVGSTVVGSMPQFIKHWWSARRDLLKIYEHQD